MVDPVTGWFEYAQLYEAPTAMRCQELFRTTWLSRYPCPRETGFDNGSEFKAEFAELTRNTRCKECIPTGTPTLGVGVVGVAH